MGALTSYGGLGNVAAPAAVVQELRRVVRPGTGRFFTMVSADLGAAGAEPPAAGTASPRPGALDWFDAAGWRVELTEPCRARVAPTPAGDLLEGFRIDTYPTTPTTVCAYLLAASAP